MFSKNYIKLIAILALGFFWCSSIYLTQSARLAAVTSQDFANFVAVCLGNLSMALGIVIFHRCAQSIASVRKFYFASTLLALVSLVIFFVSRSPVIMSVCLCLTSLLGTSGFGAGYHFALVTTRVAQSHRARVFASGYALGSILAYFVSLLPAHLYTTSICLSVYVPVIALTVYLAARCPDLAASPKEKYPVSLKKNLLVISLITLLMAFLSAISADVIAIYSFDMTGVFTNSRLYYSLGLIIAGILCDRRRELFDILTLASFVFYLISIVLLRQGVPSSIIVATAFFFLGFFVVFRTTTFMNLSDRYQNLVSWCAHGLLYSRIIEGGLALWEKGIVTHYLLFILLEAVALGSLLLVWVLLYWPTAYTRETDTIKALALKYELSIQEEKVLRLLMQDLSNQEIADQLYLSIYTVKNHAANIYKKTKMSKRQLREICQQ